MTVQEITTAKTGFFSPERKATDRQLWREIFWGMDWLALHSSPVYYGIGVPHGDKSAVIVVPGFMGTDHYLVEIYYWLRRIGYQSYFSGIGWNAECLNELTKRLEKTIDRAYDETGGKVHLIGHSLGGVLARSIAVRVPEKVKSVITLGSPIRGISSHPIVLQQSDIVRNWILQSEKVEDKACYTGYCGCAAVTAMRSEMPESIKQAAIYTETDGVVDSKVCLSEDPKRNFKVAGTHVGLVVNPQVYYLISSLLAQ